MKIDCKGPCESSWWICLALQLNENSHAISHRNRLRLIGFYPWIQVEIIFSQLVISSHLSIYIFIYIPHTSKQIAHGSWPLLSKHLWFFRDSGIQTLHLSQWKFSSLLDLERVEKRNINNLGDFSTFAIPMMVGYSYMKSYILAEKQKEEKENQAKVSDNDDDDDNVMTMAWWWWGCSWSRWLWPDESVGKTNSIKKDNDSNNETERHKAEEDVEEKRGRGGRRSPSIITTKNKKTNKKEIIWSWRNEEKKKVQSNCLKIKKVWGKEERDVRRGGRADGEYGRVRV